MQNQMTLEEIKRGVESDNYNVRCTVFQACIGRNDVPLGWLEKGINDEHSGVRCNAFYICIGRSDIPLGWLEKGINDEHSGVRCNAFQACAGRSDVPLEWLEKGANGEYSGVGATVSKILFDRGYQFPLIRMIEPADKVYKRCLEGVIVVAEIPKTAQVRGRIGEKCRTSEAVIVEIIPNEDGCVKAVSWWNKKTTYKVSDHIIIDDFDHSNVECSTGFHFFNTIDEAKSYDLF